MLTLPVKSIEALTHDLLDDAERVDDERVDDKRICITKAKSNGHWVRGVYNDLPPYWVRDRVKAVLAHQSISKGDLRCAVWRDVE